MRKNTNGDKAMRKLLAVLFCAFLAFGAVGCSDNGDVPAKKTYEEQKVFYGDIVSTYTEMLTAKANGETLGEPVTEGKDEREIDILKALCGIANECETLEETQRFGYGYKDLDGNGTPELILSAGYTRIFALFTLKEKVPVLLLSEYSTEGYIELVAENRFIMQRNTGSGTVQAVTYYTFRVEGDHIAYDAVCEKAYDTANGAYDASLLERYEIKDGERIPIDEDTFKVLYLEHQRRNEGTVPNYEGKLAAPRTCFPTKQAAADADLPLADFSDYAAIRKTYQAIAACVDDFDATRWLWGEYDNLFSFPSDDAFSYYTRLLYAAHRGGGNAGYDERDLNGDGVKELVLLGEDFRIKAVFTQKDGVPVLLDAFAQETCWIDDQGFLHVDREDYYELEYSKYEFTKSGEYRLLYSILVDRWGERYVTKEGKTQKISFEESMTLYYDDYCRYEEPFSPKEMTKAVSSLTYTPLTAGGEDLVAHALSKTWHKYANLEKSVGKTLAHSNTYLTLEGGADNALTLHIRYEFSYGYPDPDGDRVLLEDTTTTYLTLSARPSDGVFVFDEQGVKGWIELGYDCLWIVFTESTDYRFPVGCYALETSSTVL